MWFAGGGAANRAIPRARGLVDHAACNADTGNIAVGAASIFCVIAVTWLVTSFCDNSAIFPTLCLDSVTDSSKCFGGSRWG
jgi:hypothetical protein